MRVTVLTLLALGSAAAFSPSAPLGHHALSSQKATSRAGRTAPMGLRMVATKPSGSNRMNDDAFAKPLVERVERPGTHAEFEYRVIEDAINPKKLNSFEKLKLEKQGLAIVDQLEDLQAEAREKGGAEHMNPDDVNIRLKWMGLFHRPAQAPGTFMWRLRIHNGVMTSDQLKICADQINQYDGDKNRDLFAVNACADITTRQNLQLRGIRLENIVDHWNAVKEAGITSIQSGMDNVRNAVGNPIAGFDPEEIIDTRPYTKGFTDQLTNFGKGNPEYSNLPRKFNVCFVGSKEMFEHPDINDIAYYPAKNAEGKMGWNIEVGGLLMSTRCEFARPLDAWVPVDDYFHLGHAIMTTFRDFGYRYNPRMKCRLMFLIDDMGMDVFRAEVDKRFTERAGYALPREAEGGAHNMVPKEWDRRELMGVHKQADGNNWIGLLVPSGRIYADEMYKIAEVAKKYGSEEIRLTVECNVLIPHIPDSKLAEAKAELESLTRLPMNPTNALKGTVACAGNQFCGQSKINTKGHGVNLAEYIDSNFEFPNGHQLRIHWTGCPNTCGQVQIGDIGLLGTTAKNADGEVVEACNIFVGGGIGQKGAIAEQVAKNVIIGDELNEAVAKIIQEQYGAVPKGTTKPAETSGIVDFWSKVVSKVSPPKSSS